MRWDRLKWSTTIGLNGTDDFCNAYNFSTGTGSYAVEPTSSCYPPRRTATFVVSFSFLAKTLTQGQNVSKNAMPNSLTLASILSKEHHRSGTIGFKLAVAPRTPDAAKHVMTTAIHPQADVTLLLDAKGVIREATFASSLAAENASSWLGRRWIETIESLGNSNVERMVDDAKSTGISAFRQVTQRFPSGLEIPMEYTTVLLGGRAGMLAVGKNLQAVAELQSRLIAAQQTMERDHWKLREVETRYRLLFDASNEAVLILKATNFRIVEANPAALQALESPHQSRDGVAGQEFISTLLPQDRATLQAMLARVREQGKALGVIVHIGRARKSWMVRATLATSEPWPVFIVQLAPVGPAQLVAGKREAPSTDDLIEQTPDGFVVFNQAGVILKANQAFLDLIEVGSKSSVVGERLSRWLWRPGADVSVLLSHINRNRTVRMFSTIIHSELGTETEVEISAAGDREAESRTIAAVLRDVSRRLQASAGNDTLRASLASISEQVGKTPLRKLVRNAVSVVEQHYVKAALELAEGNRTAAAEILGLSRQSLYAKLDRYDLEGDGDAAAIKDD
jgi:transcriptional regulator PpsR